MTTKKEKTMNIYRHGDISFHPVSAVPAKANKVIHASYIVAYGEATGHHHELNRAAPIHGGDKPSVNDKPHPKITVHTCDDGRRFVELDYSTGLDHPEHGLLTLRPGVYEIKEERTFDYFENSIKKVID